MSHRSILNVSLIGLVAVPVSVAATSPAAHLTDLTVSQNSQTSQVPSQPSRPAGASSPAPASTPQPSPGQFNPLWWLLLILPIGAVAVMIYRQQHVAEVAASAPLKSAISEPLSAVPEPSTTSPQLDETADPDTSCSAAITVTQAQPATSAYMATRLSKIDIVETLVSDLQSPDSAKRRKAIWELGQRGDSRAMQPLVDLLIDSDSQQRSLILAAVSEIGTRSLKPINRALMLALQDESPDVRRNAIRDVTRIYELMTQVSQLLHYAVSDSDSDVQETAQWALSQLNRMQGAKIASAPAQPLSESKPSDRLINGQD